MFVGGCSGSTGGAMKVSRIMIMGKMAMRELRKMLHPRGVFQVKMQGRAVENDVISTVSAFFFFYIMIFVAASVLMVGMGLDLTTSLSSVASCMGNVGPALGEVGPAYTYSHLPVFGKLILSFCMLLGRLEIFCVLALFSPGAWKR
jgi:trk system potassium uptake protein TrkH